MEDIEIKLKTLKNTLNERLKELEILEIEKNDIMDRYSKANKAERAIIEKEMRLSEESFKSLSENVLSITQEIKKLKKKYC